MMAKHKNLNTFEIKDCRLYNEYEYLCVSSLGWTLKAFKSPFRSDETRVLTSHCSRSMIRFSWRVFSKGITLVISLTTLRAFF